MATFLTTNGTSSEIEKIIIEAKERLTLISPYLQLSKTFYERLRDASNRGINIEIIYGKDDLKPNEKASLDTLRNIHLYFFQNLHAKCYFNEKKMVITSMNMYDFSEKNNREMGVLIERSNDLELYQNAVNEADSIIQSSEEIESRWGYRRKPVSENEDQRTRSQKRGYCIRCEERIPLNAERPYCYECYSTWAQYENPDYQENVCHGCGQFESTSMGRPLCYTCYKRN